jgi:hypothetical protein
LFQDHKLELTVPADCNETGKTIKLECDCEGSHMTASFNKSSQKPLDIPFSYADYYYRFDIKITMENEDPLPVKETTFKVVAAVKVKVINEFPVVEKRELIFTYSPYQGWTLTKDGELKQGREGYLIDENDLYILEDGRRVSEELINDPQKAKYKEKEIRIGDADVVKGLRNILCFRRTVNETPIFSDSQKIQMQYKTTDLFREFGAKVPSDLHLIVYQAFQINICYKNGDLIPINGVDYDRIFYRIGWDETNIPIVVTSVKNKVPPNQFPARQLVIAGPHGNERMARFVVLETQRFYIENPTKVPENTTFHFIPAMSPTLFFADARGLPFINLIQKKETNGKIEYEISKDNKNPRDFIGKIYAELTIPLLHKFIAEEVNGVLMHTNIQFNNGSPKNPIYGIDANRDYHNLLKSTQAFNHFINVQKPTRYYPDPLPENLTVIMLHGHEDVKDRKRTYDTANNNQGTICGPYKIHDKEYGFITHDIIKQVDFMTAALFGYMYNMPGEDDRYRPFDPSKDIGTKRQKNFFYLEKIDVTEFEGEWSRKLYGDVNSQDIPCFDIELSNNYRDGTRGGAPNYKPTMVVDRHDRKYNLLFFMEGNGRFANILGNIVFKSDSYVPADPMPFVISFFDFLSSFYNYRNKEIDKLEPKK